MSAQTHLVNGKLNRTSQLNQHTHIKRSQQEPIFRHRECRTSMIRKAAMPIIAPPPVSFRPRSERRRRCRTGTTHTPIQRTHEGLWQRVISNLDMLYLALCDLWQLSPVPPWIMGGTHPTVLDSVVAWSSSSPNKRREFDIIEKYESPSATRT